MKNKKHPAGGKGGFTLTEILISMAITAGVLAASTGFLIQTTLGNHIVSQRIDHAMQIRTLSQELIYNASRAHQICLYRSVLPADRSGPDSQLNISTDGLIHPAGDFVVFVFYEVPKPANQGIHRIEKLVGYFLNAGANQVGAIRKVVIDLSVDLATGSPTPTELVPAYNTSTSMTTVEQVLTAEWGQTRHTRFTNMIQDARGLFETEVPTDTSGAGRLFYYSDARNIMVGAQMFGNRSDDRRAYTNTFHFSITPRI